MFVNHYLTNSYDFDYKVYVWYVANFTNTILIKEYEENINILFLII